MHVYLRNFFTFQAPVSIRFLIQHRKIHLPPRALRTLTSHRQEKQSIRIMSSDSQAVTISTLKCRHNRYRWIFPQGCPTIVSRSQQRRIRAVFTPTSLIIPSLLRRQMFSAHSVQIIITWQQRKSQASWINFFTTKARAVLQQSTPRVSI